MKCPQCGESLADDLGFCPYCGQSVTGARKKEEAGAELNGAIKRETESKRDCPSCWKSNPQGAVFCGYCGLPMDAANQCPGCRSTINPGEMFCTHCGRMVRAPLPPKFSNLPTGAMLLALIPGLFSIWGIGHFFAGSLTRGFGFFLLGLITIIVSPFILLQFAQSVGDLLFWAVVGFIVWIALWIWQSADAYWEAENKMRSR